MRFTSIPSNNIPEVQVVYNKDDYAFSSELLHPDSFEAIFSVALKEVQLEIDRSGQALFAWGFAPYSLWKKTRFSPTGYQRAKLFVNLDEPIIPGVSVQLAGSETWQQYINQSTGWFGMGDIESRYNLIEFASDCVASINGSELLAIWLRLNN